MALFLFDMDGVVYLGHRKIPQAVPALCSLKERGHQVYFVTNNTRSSRTDFVKELRSGNITCSKEQIITASYATALYLRKRFPLNTKILVIGEKGLREEIKKQGFKVFDAARTSFPAAKQCGVLAVGLDRRFNFNLLTLGQRVLLNPKVIFIAANIDSSWPTDQGILPGTGAMVAALEAASQRKVQSIIGKPEMPIFKEALKSARFKASECFVVGDRLEIDILCGNRLGMFTILVLTGVSTLAQAKKAVGQYRPKAILNDLSELVPLLKKKGLF